MFARPTTRWIHALESLQALSLLEKLEEHELEADVVLYGSLLSACEKCGQWTQACALMQRLEEKQLEVDIIAMNAMISAYEKLLGCRWQALSSEVWPMGTCIGGAEGAGREADTSQRDHLQCRHERL